MPWYISGAYLFNSYFWQVKIPYAIWGMVAAALAAFYMAEEFNNRLMGNIGFKPMAKVSNGITYSFIHSWITFPIFIPIMKWGDDVVAWHEK